MTSPELPISLPTSSLSESRLPVLPDIIDTTLNLGTWVAKVRIIGPTESFSRVLDIKKCDLDGMMRLVTQASEQSRLSILGYITEHDGYSSYHMLRAPLADNSLGLPSIKKYENAYAALKSTALKSGYQVEESCPSVLPGNFLALVGLRDRSAWTWHHSPFEMLLKFDKTFRVQPALIFGVEPTESTKPSIHQEWSVTIESENTIERATLVARAAHELKLPRFSLEYPDRATTRVIEFPEFL